jgi:sulfatase maturation enzyme AslB (radical SAM superfamily)
MMLPVGFVKSLIGVKKPKIAEIELTLFENCDVNCSFCGHEKASVIGMSPEEMSSKMKLIDEFMGKIDQDIESVNLHLVGGELLQDRLLEKPLNYLSHYTNLLQQYKHICQTHQRLPQALVVSNMLTRKKEQVKEWLEEVNQILPLKMIASYDPYGRPITNQYLENIEYLKDYIANINVVVTRESIQKIKQGDKIFDQLYQEFPIFMDDFLPDRESQDMIPSDEEYLEYLNFVASRYQRLLPFGDAIQKLKYNQWNEIQFTTFNKCTILPDNQVTNYLWKRHKSEFFNGPVDYQDNSQMLYTFLAENQCLSCEYFQSCPLRCPVSWSWKDRDRSPGCVNKRFFDSLKDLIV